MNEEAPHKGSIHDSLCGVFFVQPHLEIHFIHYIVREEK
jgi:hypothetical protein